MPCAAPLSRLGPCHTTPAGPPRTHQRRRTCRPVRTLGVRVASDDVGTGDSNLTYLKHFRATQVKIDRSFVPHGDTARAIMHRILGWPLAWTCGSSPRTLRSRRSGHARGTRMR
ncbi:EAL domain-containing protein [Thiomonas sp. X19]|uniref:EAL domain-containing protein n=1 Tax=Thiomonas sp. X19 TaxID=1050370 RepID=UPI000DDA9FBF